MPGTKPPWPPGKPPWPPGKPPWAPGPPPWGESPNHSRFLLMDYSHTWQDGVMTVTTVSDVACHMWLRWTDIHPRKHLRTEIDRGAAKLTEPDFCFVEYQDIEQSEPGDTYSHTFTWPGWYVCRTCWYYFWATTGGDISPSNTAVFEAHFPEGPVFSIGEYADPVVLYDNVKLEKGAGITITRDSARNLLTISAG